MPWRRRSTISSGLIGSAASIGWVTESVKARSSRAACSGSTVIRSRYRIEQRDERRTVGQRAGGLLAQPGPEVRDEPPHVRRRGPGRSAAAASCSALLERRGRDRCRRCAPRTGSVSSAASMRGREQLVLVGEDPEDGALGDAGSRGDLPGGHGFTVLEQQRRGGRDDGCPPFLGRQRRRARPLAVRVAVMSGPYECALTQSTGILTVRSRSVVLSARWLRTRRSTGPRSTSATDAERDKRLRPDGPEQYVEPTGRFAHYLDDPYVEPEPREPLFDEVDVVFIGGGFAGLVSGARLKQAGVDDVRIIEKGGDFGGTWYWNRYPGAQCDTTSFVYMPLLEEVGHMPTEKYAHAPEILEHCRNIATHFGLYDNACLSTEVTEVEWDDGSSRWLVRTNRGDEMRARFVADGNRPAAQAEAPRHPRPRDLRRPQLPHQPLGLRLHRRRPRGCADGEAGRQAGRASSAPAPPRCSASRTWLAPAASCSCSSAPRARSTSATTSPTDPDWFATLEPGWQDEWLMNFTTLQTGGFADEDLVMDGWTDIAKRIRDKVLEMGAEEFTVETMMRAFNESDDEKMEEIRRGSTRSSPTPTPPRPSSPGTASCASARASTTSTSTPTTTPTSPSSTPTARASNASTRRACGRRRTDYELDCLIYASGFEVGTDYTRRSGYEVIGRDGLTLTEHWAEGMRSLHGIHVHGFPNLFVVGPTQGANLISNIPHNLVEAGQTVAAVIRHARRHRRDRGRGHRRGRAGLDRPPPRQLPRLRWQPRLHPRLLQQRGPARRPAGDAQHGRLPRGSGRLLPVHRPPGARPATSRASSSADRPVPTHQSVGCEVLEELTPDVGAGVVAVDDRIDDAGGAVDDVERRVEAVLVPLLPAFSTGSSSLTQPVSTAFMWMPDAW